MTNGSELGIFLKARRAAIQPEDVGLPTGTSVRRTPGLRREEVAILAGVSVDYYTRLERGKETNPSPAVVDALARILRLNPDEHQHLRDLTENAARPTRQVEQRQARIRAVRQGPLILMENLRPNPAYIVSLTNDVLAANPAGLALFPGLADYSPKQRNITRYLFLDPAAKQLYPEWDKLVPRSVAYLRARAGSDPDDPDLVRLIGELVVKSKEFARLWERYEVQNIGQGTKDFQHPEVGPMTLDYEAMELANTGGQRMIAYYTVPGTADHDAVTLLDMIGSGLIAAGVEGLQQFAQPADEELVELGDGAVADGRITDR
ncbi:helix-turn-helix transcriptional regulator [Catenulispora pinisilvae]|uniref:helix-turn-helix transcriptional regulator n=1 Tax=Catenulispora pinisilvae TaxID=2705253 RepID=UPI0018918A04|nr:helix-turn-helix transcriptional regulator [Catenulispora pinisilvae]